MPPPPITLVNIRWLEPVQVSQSLSLPCLSASSQLIGSLKTCQCVIGRDLSSSETLLPLKHTHLCYPPLSLCLSVSDSLCSAWSPLALSSPGKIFDFLYLFNFFYKSENSCANGTEIILSNLRNPSRWISLSILFINKVFPNWFWDSAVKGTTWERPAGPSRFLEGH